MLVQSQRSGCAPIEPADASANTSAAEENVAAFTGFSAVFSS
jgi:hypothetical protein